MSRDQERAARIMRELNTLRGHLLALGRATENLNCMAEPDAIRRAMDQHADGFDRRNLKKILRDTGKILEYKTTVDRREKHPENAWERKRFLAYIEKGYSVSMIQADTGLSRGTVQRKLKKYSVNKNAIQQKTDKYSDIGG